MKKEPSNNYLRSQLALGKYQLKKIKDSQNKKFNARVNVDGLLIDIDLSKGALSDNLYAKVRELKNLEVNSEKVFKRRRKQN